jgi:hypothetical protein
MGTLAELANASATGRDSGSMGRNGQRTDVTMLAKNHKTYDWCYVWNESNENEMNRVLLKCDAPGKLKAGK